MSERKEETNKVWTAKRRAKLVLSILQGETSVQKASRKHGLKMAEVEAWQERFLLDAEEALRSWPNYEEAPQSEQDKATILADKQLLFIIGSPRGGTTWLQMMMGAHPLVVTTVDLTVFDHYIGPWIRSWKQEVAWVEERGVHNGLPFIWTEDEFNDFLMQFISKVYDRVIALKPQATYILDKQPSYGFYVEGINKLLPKARFINVIRDGRDVAVSIMNTKVAMKPWSGSIEIAAKMWMGHVKAAQKAKQYKGRYIEIRYEELQRAGVETLKRVFDFCDLPASEEEVTAIVNAHNFERLKATRQLSDKRVKATVDHYRKGKVGRWQEEMSPLQRYVFDDIAGDLLREFGYANDNWWAQSYFQRFGLPFLSRVSNVWILVNRAAKELGKALLGHRIITYIRTKQRKTSIRPS